MARRRLAAARGIVINGPRQCGKTELMRALHRETGGTLLSLDDTATVTAALADPGGLVTGFPVLLYIDEVQRGGDPLILAVKAMLDASRAKGQIVMSAFLTDPDDGIFRGPYLRVRTPFVAVEESWRSPLEWLPDGFRPYEHQARAFDRLSTVGGRTAEPTLVTTGVSPGCGRAVHRRERHAFVDGRDHLVDRREALRDDPPDILLTNYKMLDFLLLCREDRNLWACNESDTLRYVVLFEFRTYDGAQGTDVAMLLRRLGVTLGMSTADQPLGATVPVATSATLGSGAGALDELRQFAGKVFGVPFDADSVIGETRQGIESGESCAELGCHPDDRPVSRRAGDGPVSGPLVVRPPPSRQDRVRSCPRSRWGLVASRISGEPELGPIGKA